VTVLSSPNPRLARGLLAFGLAGIALLATAAVLVVLTVGSLAGASAELDRQRAALTDMVGPAGEALRGSARAASNAGSSLKASATTARDASALTGQLADSLDQLSALSNISFLGTQPFAASGASLSATAARSRTLSATLATTADALETNVSDSASVAADLGRLADQLDALRGELGSSPAPASTIGLVGLEIVLLGLLAWLAVPAAVAIRLGWQWSRAPRR
jgi:hypothetical protein